MRRALYPVVFLALAVLACDQLNRPMPVPSTSSSAGGPHISPPPSTTSADAGDGPEGRDAPPGDPPITKQPGDVQL